LAPAGDWEALRAAVANGADAVYFGLSNFNARYRATNFALEDLPRVMKYLHDRNVRGYIAFNTLIFSDELREATRFVEAIVDARADAVIVQDLGLARFVHLLAPNLPIHASTQMTLTEPRGIQFAKQLGIERVILARELSLTEIAKIASQTDMPLEVFVHGALCVAYSGQCLTSEALGGRSANRGQCAQACRLPYEMLVDDEARDLGDRAYLLSPQDLAAYDLIDDLVKLGVSCFKIEGRLKGAPYVAATTSTYRKALDAALQKHSFALSRQGRRDLEQCFSRGLTHGFLDGVNHQMLVQGRFPKSRGVRVGKVIGTNKRGVVIEQADSSDIVVKPGDGVVFDEGKPETDERGGRVYEVIQHNADRQTLKIEVLFGRGDIDPSQVAIGSLVWKTDDPTLKKRLEASYAGDRVALKVAVTAFVSGRVGGVLTVALQDDAGHKASAQWPGPLERAQKHAVTEAVLREQLSRLGETPFDLSELVIDLPEGVMVPKSVLNSLRRDAVDKLLKARISGQKPMKIERNALDLLRQEAEAQRTCTEATHSRFYVLVRTLEQLDAVLGWIPPAPLNRPSLVYCDFEDVRRYRPAVSRAREAGVPIGLATLRIVKPGEDGWLRQIGECQPDAILVRNLAALMFYKSEFPNVSLIGDFSLNVANELTADLLVQHGLERLAPSYDLNWEQLAALLGRIDPVYFELVVHQHMPMFHMEHCVFAAFLSKGKDHRDCGRPCDRHKVDLRDRVGAAFPVIPDVGCRNTVFNSVAQSAAEYLPRMQSLGVRHFRVELLREHAAEVGPLLEDYARVLAGLDNGKKTWRHLQALNQLGITRGTLQMV
jgi:putative protease